MCVAWGWPTGWSAPAGRADLFGPEWIAEFEKLHSHVPAVPLEALLPHLREDLGGEPQGVFARFDAEPLAAASIAQVHRAQLKDGTEVVVKIRRPGITEVIEADLRLLDRLAALAESNLPALKPYRPQLLVREFAKSLRRKRTWRLNAVTPSALPPTWRRCPTS